MKPTVLCLCFLLGILSAAALPYNPYYGRPRRTPYQHRAMMLAGYYGNPYRRSAYTPEATMTAFASGDTLATNQYPADQYQPQEPLALDIPIEENVVKEAVPEEHTELAYPPLVETHTEAEPAVEHDAPTTIKPKRIPKRKLKPQQPVENEEEEDDEEEEEEHGYFPFPAPGRRGGSSVYFPIVFGGYPGARGRNADEGTPGSATAIANSFSTGKGGVASSHATAYGDPYAGLYLRGVGKRRNPQQD